MNGPHRNQGLPLDLHWVRHCELSDAEAAARADPYDKEWPAEPADIRRLAGFVDLAGLGGDETPNTTRALCARATDVAGEKVAAVAVYPVYVAQAVEALAISGVQVTVAAGGFPHGLSPLSSRLDEVRESVKAGATEVDVVIRRSLALAGDWRALYDEVRAMREVAGALTLKTILATGELRTSCCILQTALVCMMAGADFVKTSTGKEAVNATLPAGVAMSRAIVEYRERTGFDVGLKPSGGIQTVSQALRWTALARDELGERWLTPDLLRIGASKLADDIEKRLLT